MQQISVTALVRYLKNKLDSDNNLQRVLVSGELSNFHRHSSGHLYFTLKDENSAINCVMFKSSADSLKFEPKIGDKVIVQANASIFETTGQLQLYVLKMSLDGLGDLYAQYEALKSKLKENGIFDEENKIELPKTYLENVAVLVGDNSAAMSDIKTTFARRWPLCNVDYYPVLVQGNDAPKQIIEKLIEVDRKNYDAIILARGGGSFEDLFCFNDEKLIMCIYKLKTFIITGVGHEQDFTLVDFVADQRAATPTASVELITPNITDVIIEINDYENEIKDNLIKLLDNNKMKIDFYLQKLLNYQNKLDRIKLDVDNDLYKIISIIKQKIEENKLTLKRYSTLLEAYNIENTLKRGYSIVIQDDHVITKKNKLKNKEFGIKFIDGTIKAKEI